ncbi:MAG: response regulator [Mariprofundus sp.]|nr:response regulator [Mariprofundus sp.]
MHTDKTKPTILIVDDMPENIDVLEGLLSPHYRVKVATSGKRALKIAESMPDLILLDVMMPGMDGYEVCRHLKQKRKLRRIPVIFVTAKSEVDDETRGFELGAVDYISKPVSPPLVLARVKNIIALFATKRRLREIMDKTLTGCVELLTDVLSLTAPAAFGRSSSIRRHIKAAAKQMGHSNTWRFEVAAMLSQLGCIALPDELVDNIHNGSASSDEEKKIFASHPEVGKRLLEKIPNLRDVAEIVALQHQTVDTIEANLQISAGVKLGASLLHLAMQQDDKTRHTSVMQKAGSTEPQVGEQIELSLSDLQLGMRLESEVSTRKGWKLVPKGTEITKAVLERLSVFDDHFMIAKQTYMVTLL